VFQQGDVPFGGDGFRVVLGAVVDDENVDIVGQFITDREYAIENLANRILLVVRCGEDQHSHRDRNLRRVQSSAGARPLSNPAR